MKQYITYIMLGLMVGLSSCQKEGINPMSETARLRVALEDNTGASVYYGVWLNGEQMPGRGTSNNKAWGYVTYGQLPLEPLVFEVFEVDENQELISPDSDALFSKTITIDTDKLLSLDITVLKLIKIKGVPVQENDPAAVIQFGMNLPNGIDHITFTPKGGEETPITPITTANSFMKNCETGVEGTWRFYRTEDNSDFAEFEAILVNLPKGNIYKFMILNSGKVYDKTNYVTFD